MKRYLFALTVAAIAIMPTTALAGNAAGSVDVSATAVASCNVLSAPVVFPTYDGNAAKYGTGRAGFICSTPVLAKVYLGGGERYIGSPASRHMRDGSGNLLSYSLRDALGADWFPSGWRGNTVKLRSYAWDVHGVLPGWQTFVPGSYADAVQITVLF